MALMTLEALGHNALMIPVYRGWAKVSKIAHGERPDYMERGALDDSAGMARIRTVAKRVVEISRKMKFSFYTPLRFLRLSWKLFFVVKFFTFREIVSFLAASPLLVKSVVARDIQKGRFIDSLKRTFIPNSR